MVKKNTILLLQNVKKLNFLPGNCEKTIFYSKISSNRFEFVNHFWNEIKGNLE